MKKAGLLLSPPFLSVPIFPTTPKSFNRITPAKAVLIPSSIIKNSSTPKEDHGERKTMAVEEIRVCTNRTCRKQGSLDILQILYGISPPCLSINSCGCLGRCGAGPNVVVLPQGLFVSHCGTPSKAAHLVISLFCGGYGDGEVERKTRECLEALSLRKRAEDEMGKGNFDDALLLLSQAIDLKPIGGVHVMYKIRGILLGVYVYVLVLSLRSTARLATGNISEALEDAKQALTLAPTYPEGYICQGDALMAMDQFDGTEKSYAMALDLDPSLRRSKSFKARVAMLQEKLTPVNPV